MIAKKSIICFVLCIALCCLCPVSCSRPGTINATGYYDAYAIACKGIPIYWNDTDATRFNKVKRLDEDDYGRSLYSLCYGFDERYFTLLIVCQLVEGNKNADFTVGWYDECWSVKSTDKNDFAAFDNEEIDYLKEQNDWAKPLDRAKMNIETFYTESSSVRRKPNADYSAYKMQKNEEEAAIRAAVDKRFGEGCAIGSLFHKNNLIYTIVHKTEGNMGDGYYFFICFDFYKKEISRAALIQGDVLDCRDSFLDFIE